MTASQQPGTGCSVNSGEITQLLAALRRGEQGAQETLYDVVYDELRRRAAHLLRKGQLLGLSSGTLVHEVYLRVLQPNSGYDFKDRLHFFALTSLAMRRFIVDHIRRVTALKRSGNLQPLSLDDANWADGANSIEYVLSVSEACDRLRASYPDLISLVEMKFFAGLTIAEIAELMGISENTVSARLKYALAHLKRSLKGVDQR